MTEARRELAESYVRALQDYLQDGGEAALARAYELGRKAVIDGLGVLEMAALHHEALRASALRPAASEDRAKVGEVAQAFFMESLSPFEMTHRASREANSALRRLNERLEEEAKRIARTLHDDAAQLLASAHLALAEMSRDLSPSARGRVEAIRGLLDGIESELRRLSHELRPMILDDLGLLPALQFLASGIAKRTGLQVEVTGSTNGRLSPTVELAVYRIVQEALTNAVRHANAERVKVRLLHEPQVIRCSIADDGVGFDAGKVLSRGAGSGLGLVSIRERLDAVRGSLQITSAPGRGTKVHVTIPCEG
ncbi:MAG TPA: ATP-binding protein [Solirubrobacterales bacterium]|nr:ATP-binding protein [Solirubrobacterales bacterium]